MERTVDNAEPLERGDTELAERGVGVDDVEVRGLEQDDLPIRRASGAAVLSSVAPDGMRILSEVRTREVHCQRIRHSPSLHLRPMEATAQGHLRPYSRNTPRLWALLGPNFKITAKTKYGPYPGGCD